MFYRNVATVTNTATNKGDNKLNILEYSNQFNQSINQSINQRNFYSAPYKIWTAVLNNVKQMSTYRPNDTKK